MEEKEPKNNKNTDAKEENGAPEPEKSADGECAELKDRLLRLAAEFDNYKKRVAKDIDGAKDMGRADVMLRILPTLDEFELALEASVEKQDEHMKGIALIFSNLVSALKGLGLKEINSDGKFDPYRHEIILGRDSSRPEGEIIEVVRKGYTLNNIMLRPASVIISKKESNDKQNDADKKE